MGSSLGNYYTSTNTRQHEYNTSATHITQVQCKCNTHNTSTTLNNKDNTSKTWVQHDTKRAQHERTQDNASKVRHNTNTTRRNTISKEARQQR